MSETIGRIRGPPCKHPLRGPDGPCSPSTCTKICVDKQQPLAVYSSHDERVTIRRRHDVRSLLRCLPAVRAAQERLAPVSLPDVHEDLYGAAQPDAGHDVYISGSCRARSPIAFGREQHQEHGKNLRHGQEHDHEPNR